MAYATTWPGGAWGSTSFLKPTDEGPVRVSVIIPTLNEARNLPYVLPRIPSWVHEVILVDGRSTDDTVDVARRLLPSIRVVDQLGRGKGAALRSGLDAATGDIAVLMDADGSTDPGEIPAFVGALLSGADLAKGSRFMQGAGTADMSHVRRLGNLGLTLMVRMLFGGQYSDLCYGYNACWMSAVPRLGLDCDGFEIETLINVRALRAGLKIAEVASFEAERITGVSRLRTIPDGWRVLKTICREWRSEIGQRLSGRRTAAPASVAAVAMAALSDEDAPILHPQFEQRHQRLMLKQEDAPRSLEHPATASGVLAE
jgi:hypothetical protein